VAPGLSDLAFGGRSPGVASDVGLLGCDLTLVPGLPDLALGGRPPGVLVVGLGLGDGAPRLSRSPWNFGGGLR
jgi:hypothetical protein